jgi:hypothetical protein
VLNGTNLGGWSRTQPTVAMSSCEAELSAIWTGGQESTFVRHLCQDLGQTIAVTVCTDSSSSIDVSRKRGPGRMKHLELKLLWLQDAARSGDIVMSFVPTAENGADIFTKHVTRAVLHKLRGIIGWFVEPPVIACVEAPRAETEALATQAPEPMAWCDWCDGELPWSAAVWCAHCNWPNHRGTCASLCHRCGWYFCGWCYWGHVCVPLNPCVQLRGMGAQMVVLAVLVLVQARAVHGMDPDDDGEHQVMLAGELAGDEGMDFKSWFNIMVAFSLVGLLAMLWGCLWLSWSGFRHCCSRRRGSAPCHVGQVMPPGPLATTWSQRAEPRPTPRAQPVAQAKVVPASSASALARGTALHAIHARNLEMMRRGQLVVPHGPLETMDDYGGDAQQWAGVQPRTPRLRRRDEVVD